MKKTLSHLWIIMTLVFLYLPIVVLAFYSFTNARMVGEKAEFSVDNYITLFTESELVSMMTGTVLLALAVAVFSTVLGTLGAVGVFYSKKRFNMAASIINQIPVVNADVVTGFSVCILFVSIFTVDKATYIPLIVGQTVLCAPFVFLSVMPRLKQMDTKLYEAALDLGCPPMKAVWHVIIPQISSGIISGFAMAITLSLDDYFIATYTKPATFDTISTYVVNATKGAQTAIRTALWGLSTIIFIVVVLCVLIANRRKEEE